MNTSSKVGILAVVLSIFISIVVLTNTENGRMAQGGVLGELIAFSMFTYAGVKGSRWWFTGMLAVSLFGLQRPMWMSYGNEE